MYEKKYLLSVTKVNSLNRKMKQTTPSDLATRIVINIKQFLITLDNKIEIDASMLLNDSILILCLIQDLALLLIVSVLIDEPHLLLILELTKV
jgi:hypothetical protein